MLSYNAAHAAAITALGVGRRVIIQMRVDIKYTSVHLSDARAMGYLRSARGFADACMMGSLQYAPPSYVQG